MSLGIQVCPIWLCIGVFSNRRISKKVDDWWYSNTDWIRKGNGTIPFVQIIFDIFKSTIIDVYADPWVFGSVAFVFLEKRITSSGRLDKRKCGSHCTLDITFIWYTSIWSWWSAVYILLFSIQHAQTGKSLCIRWKLGTKMAISLFHY